MVTSLSAEGLTTTSMVVLSCSETILRRFPSSSADEAWVTLVRASSLIDTLLTTLTREKRPDTESEKFTSALLWLAESPDSVDVPVITAQFMPHLRPEVALTAMGKPLDHDFSTSGHHQLTTTKCRRDSADQRPKNCLPAGSLDAA